jgi:magnesium transporter
MTTIEQRTKLDVLDDALFLVCKFIYRDINGTGHVNIEQICFYLKENILITVQETPKELFDSIKSKKQLTKYNFIMISFYN